MAHLFKDAGYATALFGKWGLGEVGSSGHPNRMGFDTFFGYLNQRHAHNYYPSFLFRNETRVPLGNVPEKEDEEGAGWARTRVEYAHDRIVEEALRWVDANRERPFFLYLAVTIPHANNEAKAATGDGQEVPDYGDYAKEPWPKPDKGQAAMISRLDRDVGRLLAKLEELGLARDTLVLFSSDNGPHQEGGNDPERFRAGGPLRGLKRALYEGGIRVPTIARWPGRIAAGLDLVPRRLLRGLLRDLRGAARAEDAPAGLDSVSLLPTLTGQARAAEGRTSTSTGSSTSRAAGRPCASARGRPSASRWGRGPCSSSTSRTTWARRTTSRRAREDLVARAVRYMDEAHVPDPAWTVRLEQEKEAAHGSRTVVPGRSRGRQLRAAAALVRVLRAHPQLQRPLPPLPPGRAGGGEPGHAAEAPPGLPRARGRSWPSCPAGEPLLRPDLVEIVRTLKAGCGPAARLRQHQRGAPHPRPLRRPRGRRGGRGSRLPRLPDERHDAFRAIPGLFGRIRALLAGLPPRERRRVVLTTVLHAGELPRGAPDVARLALDWGVNVNFSAYTSLRTNDTST